jgi:hypothetical protein
MVGDTRQHAHELIDQLPEAQLSGVIQLLETIVEPVYRIENAPVDDEPFTEEDREAVAEAADWLRKNEPIPHEQVLAEFGITVADWQEMAEQDSEPPPPGARSRPSGYAHRLDGTG